MLQCKSGVRRMRLKGILKGLLDVRDLANFTDFLFVFPQTRLYIFFMLSQGRGLTNMSHKLFKEAKASIVGRLSLIVHRNCGLCDKSVKFGTHIAKDSPKTIRYLTIMNFQCGGLGSHFSRLQL